MIEYNPRNWLAGIFNMHTSQLMRKMIFNMMVVGIYTGIVVYVLVDVWALESIMKMTIHKLLGIVLGLVLVFRTNTAYDRWWEGRKLIGALVNHSRSLASKLNALLSVQDKESREFFASSISNFAFSLKEHLREGTIIEEFRLKGYPQIEAVKKAAHIPNIIVSLMQDRLRDMLAKGNLDSNEYIVLSRETDGLFDVLGGTERIRKTPIPYSYGTYIKKVIFVYVTTLPIGFAEEFHYWSIPAVMFIFYVLVGIELIAEEVEDPFGKDANDLDTDNIAINIRGNVEELLKV